MSPKIQEKQHENRIQSLHQAKKHQMRSRSQTSKMPINGKRDDLILTTPNVLYYKDLYRYVTISITISPNEMKFSYVSHFSSIA